MHHNRRQFIGQCATMVKTSAVSAMIGRMPADSSLDQPLLNWAGNYQYSTQRITSATSVQPNLTARLNGVSPSSRRRLGSARCARSHSTAKTAIAGSRNNAHP